jgi:hypothetical protein
MYYWITNINLIGKISLKKWIRHSISNTQIDLKFKN